VEEVTGTGTPRAAGVGVQARRERCAEITSGTAPRAQCELRATARKMEVGPLEAACRGGLQTASSGCGRAHRPRAGVSACPLEGALQGVFANMRCAWIAQHIPMTMRVRSQWLRSRLGDRGARLPTTAWVPPGGSSSPVLSTMGLEELEAVGQGGRELCRSAMRSQAESATRFQGSRALPVPGKRAMWYKVRDATARIW
jgi:hypothetical protein